MTWVVVYDSNTSSDFASSQGPVSAGSILVNGWTDVYGDNWTTASGNLNATPTVLGNPPYQAETLYLSRPSSENEADSRIVIYIPAGQNSSQGNYAYLRWNGESGASTGGYVVFMGVSTYFTIQRVVSGGGTVVAGSSSYFTYNSSHAYTIDFSIIGTSLSATLYDVTASTTIGTITATDSIIAGPGSYTLACTGSGTALYNFATRVITYKNVTPSFTLTPNSGNLSNSYSVTATGTVTAWTSGTTFSGSGVSGTSVVTNSVNVGAQTASLTITTGSTSGTLVVSNSTDANTANFSVNAIIPVTDPGFLFSPFTWVFNGSTSVTTNCAGAYFWFNFTGTSCTLNFNTSTLGGNPLYLKWCLDGGVFTTTNIQGTSSLTIGTGLSNAAHTVLVYYDARTFALDTWNTPSNGLIITGMALNSGATTSAPPVRPHKMLCYGDSRGEGIWCAAAPEEQDATYSAAFIIAEGINAELGLRAFAGIDYVINDGETNVPPLFTPSNDTSSSWNKYWAGTSLLTSGVFTTQPDYIFVLDLGVNGRSNAEATVQASVNGFMTAIRAAAPAAKIYIGNGSYEGYNSTAVTNAYNAYQAATPDPQLFLLQYNLTTFEQNSINITNSASTCYAPFDPNGGHPALQLQSLIAARLIPQIQSIGTAYAF